MNILSFMKRLVFLLSLIAMPLFAQDILPLRERASLIDQIQKNTDAKLILGTPQLIEYKEALIFGFLGLLRQQSKINCWASVTGASKNHSTGRLFFPKQ